MTLSQPLSASTEPGRPLGQGGAEKYAQLRAGYAPAGPQVPPALPIPGSRAVLRSWGPENPGGHATYPTPPRGPHGSQLPALAHCSALPKALAGASGEVCSGIGEACYQGPRPALTPEDERAPQMAPLAMGCAQGVPVQPHLPPDRVSKQALPCMARFIGVPASCPHCFQMELGKAAGHGTLGFPLPPPGLSLTYRLLLPACRGPETVS